MVRSSHLSLHPNRNVFAPIWCIKKWLSKIRTECALPAFHTLADVVQDRPSFLPRNRCSQASYHVLPFCDLLWLSHHPNLLHLCSPSPHSLLPFLPGGTMDSVIQLPKEPESSSLKEHFSGPCPTVLKLIATFGSRPNI